ncbi:MAG TPA: GlsB/YeaQ/YmgE family stress response membrane protein [Aliiroseovarius sp.]|nr:GlsB/YeaQ/YmgE family stress response membrane protein [Aliiroseovarius sp.]
MMLLLYIVIGAFVGFLATVVIDMKTGQGAAIGISALGGLVGGLAFHIVLPMPVVVFGTVGAIVGALLLLWIVSVTVR